MLSKAEWETAKRLFLALPPDERVSGKKIKRGTESLSHSFILMQGGYLLALANKADGILGRGGYSRVKLAEDEEGNLYALKLLVGANSSSFFSEQEEIEVAHDVGAAKEPHITSRQLNSKIKVYLPYLYLGESLDVFLKNHALTDDEACRIAIQLALLIDDFHKGKSSKTGRHYYHGDLKPSNITIDKAGHLHLIDFDRKDAFTKGYSHKFDGKERDLFSYLRVIFSSSALSFNWEHETVLRLYFVNQHPGLAELLDTTNDKLNPEASLLEIAKILTRIRCHLDETASLETTQDIRNANAQYETTLIQTEKATILDDKLVASITQFNQAVRALKEELVITSKQIDDIEQEKNTWLERLDAIAEPLFLIFKQQDNQTRKSACFSKYYDLKYYVDVLAARKITMIKSKQYDAKYSRDYINTINIDTLQETKKYTDFQLIASRDWKHFKCADVNKIYINDFSVIEQKKIIWMGAVANKVREFGLVLEESKRGYQVLDLSDTTIQEAVVHAVDKIKDESFMHACVANIHEMRPILKRVSSLEIILHANENPIFKRILIILINNKMSIDNLSDTLELFIKRPDNAKDALPVFECYLEQKQYINEEQVEQYFRHFFSLTPILIKQPDLNQAEIAAILESDPTEWLEANDRKRYLFSSLMKKLAVYNELIFHVAADFDMAMLEYLHQILPLFERSEHLSVIIWRDHQTTLPMLKKLQSFNSIDPTLIKLCGRSGQNYNSYKRLFQIILQLDNPSFQQLNFDLIKLQFDDHNKSKLEAFNQSIIKQQTPITVQTLNAILTSLQIGKQELAEPNMPISPAASQPIIPTTIEPVQPISELVRPQVEAEEVSGAGQSIYINSTTKEEAGIAVSQHIRTVDAGRAGLSSVDRPQVEKDEPAGAGKSIYINSTAQEEARIAVSQHIRTRIAIFPWSVKGSTLFNRGHQIDIKLSEAGPSTKNHVPNHVKEMADVIEKALEDTTTDWVRVLEQLKTIAENALKPSIRSFLSRHNYTKDFYTFIKNTSSSRINVILAESNETFIYEHPNRFKNN